LNISRCGIDWNRNGAGCGIGFLAIVNGAGGEAGNLGIGLRALGKPFNARLFH
jgi:hypothetical protein